MQDLLPCIVVEPRAPQLGSVILMHGIGASADDFAGLIPTMDLPGVRFVCPNAPKMPVTIAGGYVMPAWYDIFGFDRAGIRENDLHIVKSAERIRALIDHERARGVPSDRIVLAGFSQGAAMALYTGLRYPEPLAGILVISGYSVLTERLGDEASEANRETPISFCHGRHDATVPIQLARLAYEVVSGWSRGEVDWAEFPIGHHVSDAELRSIGAWMRDRFRTH